MDLIDSDTSATSCLKFVFASSVLSYSLTPQNTLEDVARAAERCAEERYGDLRCVEIVLSVSHILAMKHPMRDVHPHYFN
jgi:hypothetical protein